MLTPLNCSAPLVLDRPRDGQPDLYSFGIRRTNNTPTPATSTLDISPPPGLGTRVLNKTAAAKLATLLLTDTEDDYNQTNVSQPPLDNHITTGASSPTHTVQMPSTEDITRQTAGRKRAWDTTATRHALGRDVDQTPHLETQNGTRCQENEGSGYNNKPNRLTNRRKSPLWTNLETLALTRIVENYMNGEQTMTVYWSNIHQVWCNQRAEGEQLHDRSPSSLKTRYNTYIKQQTVTPPPAPDAQTASPEDTTTTDEAAIQPEVIPTLPETIPPNQEPPRKEPGKTPVSGSDLEQFTTHFRKYFNQAFRQHKRRPLKKPVRRITATLIDWVNNLITEGMLNGPNQIDRLSALVYASGRTINWFMDEEYNKSKQNQLTNWKTELTDRLDKLDTDVEQLNFEINRRIKGQPLDDNTTTIRKEHKGSTAQLTATKHDLTTKANILRNKLKVRTEEVDRKTLRKQPPKYALAEKVKTETPVDETRDFWEPIIGKTKDFEASPELKQWEEHIKRSQTELPPLKTEEHKTMFTEVCRKARPWKAPGPDGIQNLWWKLIPAAKNLLEQWILAVRSGEKQPQKWISTGRIVLLHKGGNPDDPGNYRPIACLNTCYKFLTGMLTRWLLRHIEAAKILPPEQLALCKGLWGCTQAHILDRVITFDARLRGKKPLSMAWVDFSKAFDSINHKYLRWALTRMGIPRELRQILYVLMDNWVVRYQGFRNDRTVMSKPLEVRNGVLQGDTLSPLLFCIAIAPISYWLNANIPKYETSNGKIKGHSVKLGHLYYMDDLKIYTNSPSELDRALTGVETIGLNIGLKINEKKCATIHINQRDQLATRGLKLNNIPLIGETSSYKYLGIPQNSRVSQHEAFQTLEKAVLDKATTIWNSNLTFGQKVLNTNSQIMTKANYIFQNLVVGNNRFECTIDYARRLDKKLLTVLKANDAKFKATSKERLYMDRNGGGFGLQTFEETLERAIIYAWCYLCTRPELQNAWKIFHSNDENRGKRSLLSDMRFILKSELYKHARMNELIFRVDGQPTISVNGTLYHEPTRAARAICNMLHEIRHATYYDKWKSGPLHGQVLNNPDLDLARTLRWMSQGKVGSRVMKVILGAQEGMLVTREFERLKYHRTNGLCRMKCHTGSQRTAQTETTQHIVSCCPHWRPGLMLERHNAVAKAIHWYLCREFRLGTYHYSKEPDAVKENDAAVLLWDHAIPTEKPLKHNRPDIILIDKERKTIHIIEIRVSWPTSLLQEERRKLRKYGVNSNLDEEFDINQPCPAGDNLAHELTQVYRGYSAKVLPIVIGVFGEISCNTLNYMREANIPLNDTVDLLARMSRAAAIGTYRIILAHTSVRENGPSQL